MRQRSGAYVPDSTQGSDGKPLLGHLDKQETDAWTAFSDGVVRLTTYLAEHHPEEYNALLAWDAERRDDEDYNAHVNADSPGVPKGTLQKRYGKRLEQAIEKAKETDGPTSPHDFVRSLLSCYRANFDPEALKAEADRLEAEHTALMKQWGDLPTPRAKEKAKAELTALEARIEELERQQQDAAGVVEEQYRQMLDLYDAVAVAKVALKSDNDERALRQRAEALQGIIQRIECTFTATGRSKGGRGGKTTRLAKVTIYPVSGDARHFFIEAANVLLPTRATSHI